MRAITTYESAHARLRRMQLQPAPSKPPLHAVPESQRFLRTASMDNSIAGIAFKRFARVFPASPLVERVMQKQIGQYP